MRDRFPRITPIAQVPSDFVRATTALGPSPRIHVPRVTPLGALGFPIWASATPHRVAIGTYTDSRGRPATRWAIGSKFEYMPGCRIAAVAVQPRNAAAIAYIEADPDATTAHGTRFSLQLLEMEPGLLIGGSVPHPPRHLFATSATERGPFIGATRLRGVNATPVRVDATRIDALCVALLESRGADGLARGGLSFQLARVSGSDLSVDIRPIRGLRLEPLAAVRPAIAAVPGRAGVAQSRIMFSYVVHDAMERFSVVLGELSLDGLFSEARRFTLPRRGGLHDTLLIAASPERRSLMLVLTYANYLVDAQLFDAEWEALTTSTEIEGVGGSVDGAIHGSPNLAYNERTRTYMLSVAHNAFAFRAVGDGIVCVAPDNRDTRCDASSVAQYDLNPFAIPSLADGATLEQPDQFGFRANYGRNWCVQRVAAAPWEFVLAAGMLEGGSAGSMVKASPRWQVAIQSPLLAPPTRSATSAEVHAIAPVPWRNLAVAVITQNPAVDHLATDIYREAVALRFAFMEDGDERLV